MSIESLNAKCVVGLDRFLQTRRQFLVVQLVQRMCAHTLRHRGTQPSTCPGSSCSMVAIILSLMASLAGSCGPSYGSV
jgi:hypothetical protein